MRSKNLIYQITLILLMLIGETAVSQNNNESVIEKIISEMTLEEKIRMIGGYQGFYIRPLERMGIPKVRMADGPVGVRNVAPSTAYSSSIMLASTWNVELAKSVGGLIGKEAKSKNINVMLGPAINIYRAPMCGRNFEYFGEDPYLAGKMASSYITGMQAEGIMSCVKHYAANNQEFDRHNVSSDMDERTLQEIYLPAFKMCVEEGKVAAVMTSYNLINGVHASQNDHLISEILKKDWGFDGFVMSDWGSTYDGVAAAQAGLDIEMPKAEFMCVDTLLPAIKSGKLPEEIINDKVRRMLRCYYRFGLMGKTNDSENIFNKDSSYAVALQEAREGIVLLKNEDDILPLSKDKIKSIVVIGPNAFPAITGGGGSSAVPPYRKVSAYEGIKRLADKNKISVSYYRTIYAPEFNKYFFILSATGLILLILNPLCYYCFHKFVYLCFIHHFLIFPAPSIQEGVNNGEMINENKVYSFDDTVKQKEKAIEAVKKSDAAIVCVGFNDGTEEEGRDRPYSIPQEQIQLIRDAYKANPNIIVILNAGGNAAIGDWIKSTKALIHAWYPGQEGGTALAEIIFGEVNPSGKLPISIEKKWEDDATFNSYYDTDKDKKVFYKEGIFLGYRHFDKDTIEPLFPFGFGMSYTTFKYDNLIINKEKFKSDESVEAAMTITNIGQYDGSEVVQLYVREINPSVPRPVKELKGFAKKYFKKGEEGEVKITLNKDAFSFYSPKEKKWIAEPGKFEILIGSSSKDIRLKKGIELIN